jgi:hypothetical protein
MDICIEIKARSAQPKTRINPPPTTMISHIAGDKIDESHVKGGRVQ